MPIEKSALLIVKRSNERSRFRKDQVIGILRQAEARMRAGHLCRKHGSSGITWIKGQGAIQPGVGRLTSGLSDRKIHAIIRFRKTH